MSKHYKHIFFDLDHTIWDFSKNTSDTLCDIIEVFDLDKLIPDNESWVKSFSNYNQQVWEKFDLGRFNKSELRIERFRLLLSDIDVFNEDLAEKLSSYFIAHNPHKSALMPYAIECLEYLSKKYLLHIISNGFYEIQETKLKASGIYKYFKRITTSDRVLSAKPDRRVFEEALKPVNAKKTESIMVGDSFERDVMGAMKFGIDQVWYNTKNEEAKFVPTYTINSLLELKRIF